MIPRARLLFLCLVITSLFLTFRYVYRTDQFAASAPVTHERPQDNDIPVPKSPYVEGGETVAPPKDPKKEDHVVETEPQEPEPGEPEEEHHGKQPATTGKIDDHEHPEVHDDLKAHKPDDKGLGMMQPKPGDTHPQSGVDDYDATKPSTKKPSTVSDEDRANEAGGTGASGGASKAETATAVKGSELDKDPKWVQKIDAKVEAAVDASKQARTHGKKDIKDVGSRSALLADLYRQQAKTKFTSAVLEKAITALQGAMYPWLTHERFSYKRTSEMMASVSSGKGKRGLVIPVSQGSGSHGSIKLAGQMITIVRKVLKSAIPIEVMYMGEQELHGHEVSELKKLGEDITVVDMKKAGFFDNDLAGLPNTNAAKSFALLASSFDEAIVADQDVVFFIDPLSAFESDEYFFSGTVFYHARASMNPSKKGDHADLVKELDTILRDVPWKYKQGSRFFESNKAKQSGREMDSSVFVVDKRRTWPALLMAANMNAKPLRDDWTYNRMKSDRESYWLAFALSHVQYSFTSGYAGDLGTAIRAALDGGMDPTTAPTVNAERTLAYELGTYLCNLHTWHHMDSKRAEAFWMSGSLYKDMAHPDGGFLQPDRVGYVDMTEGDEGFGSGKDPQVCLGGKKREISVVGAQEGNKLKQMLEVVKGPKDKKRWGW